MENNHYSPQPSVERLPDHRDQPRILDRSRFEEGPLAILSEEEMVSVERAFLGVCDMFHYAIHPRWIVHMH